MTSSSSAAESAKKRAFQYALQSEEDKRAEREYYGKMTLQYARQRQVIAAAVEVNSVGTQTDETLSFNNAKVELMGGNVVAIDKKLADVIHCKGFQ